MKKGILYIREAIESSNLCCGGEDLLIVGALNMSISLGNKASFAALYSAIRIVLDFVNQFAAFYDANGFLLVYIV